MTRQVTSCIQYASRTDQAVGACALLVEYIADPLRLRTAQNPDFSWPSCRMGYVCCSFNQDCTGAFNAAVPTWWMLLIQVVYFHCNADADSPCGAPHKAFNSTSSRPYGLASQTSYSRGQLPTTHKLMPNSADRDCLEEVGTNVQSAALQPPCWGPAGS
ncbi:hypothetical protein ABBQ38_003644 [Trebouxia sp. C0009 RCD-2024]